MPSVLNPYLNFRGTARAAMEFYRDVLGGDLEVATYADFRASEEPADDDLVMHSKLTSTNGYVLMASDVPDRRPLVTGSSIAVSLGGDAEDGLEGYWNALAEGAQVLYPLAASPWGDRFGSLIDRYGTTWLVNVAAAPAS